MDKRSRWLGFVHAVINNVDGPFITGLDLHTFVWRYYARFKEAPWGAAKLLPPTAQDPIYIRKVHPYIPIPTRTKLQYLFNQFNNLNTIKIAYSSLQELPKFNIGYLSHLNRMYPKELKYSSNLAYPYILYFYPNTQLIKQKIAQSTKLAIVGTRTPSIYTIDKSFTLIQEILNKVPDLTIVSGRAKGCDSIAYYLAMKQNHYTINVVAHLSISELHPRDKEILISEYILQNFRTFKIRLILRNRIISALSQTTLVLQAPLKSGSLITANFTKQLNKPVFFIKPESINFKTAGGVYFKHNYKKAYYLTTKSILSMLRYLHGN